jgi:hypothetical protein
MGRPTSLCTVASKSSRTKELNDRDRNRSSGTQKSGGMFEGMEIFIAVGTQEGKVFVFDVLGLSLHEASMGGPVVTVEWVGDMSAPSALPCHLSSSLHPSPSQLSYPGQDTPMFEHNTTAEECTCTVCRNESPTKPFDAVGSFSNGNSKDLFASIHRDHKNNFSKQSTETYRNLYAAQTRPVNRSRRSHPRPRIVTDTFRVPSPPSMSSALASSRSMAKPKPSEIEKRSGKHAVLENSLMTGALNSSNDFNGSQEGNDESTVFDSSDVCTPPASQREKDSAMLHDTPVVGWSRLIPRTGDVNRAVSPTWLPSPVLQNLTTKGPTPPPMGSRFKREEIHQSFQKSSSSNEVNNKQNSLRLSLSTPRRRRSSVLAVVPNLPRPVKFKRRQTTPSTTPKPQVHQPSISNAHDGESSTSSQSHMESRAISSPMRPYLHRSATAGERFREMRRFLHHNHSGLATNIVSSTDAKDSDRLRTDNEQLRREMLNLREEFRLLRSAMLAVRGA